MRFGLWLENELKVIDSNELTPEKQHLLGNAAVVEDGHLVGYHVTDNTEKIKQTLQSSKKLTATYRKGVGKYAEMGPGLYVSATPQLWLNRSTGKWDFLKTLTPEQRKRLAEAIRNDRSLKGQMVAGRLFRNVTQNEEESANRWIDEWLNSGHDPILVMLAGQPYNIHFWKPEFLKPLGIEPSQPPKVLEVKFSGKFANLSKHVNDWPVIADYIRKGLDGGFNPGGMVAYPELCIWRKECIMSIN